MIEPNLFDIVELLIDLPEKNLFAGMQGTIVEQYDPRIFEIEFSDENGQTLSLCTLEASQFFVVWQSSSQQWLNPAEQLLTKEIIMTPNPIQRPQPRRQPQNQANQAIHRGNNNPPNRGNNNQRNGGNNNPPSPWLYGTPSPDSSASFVEYLRWMREPDHEYKDPTKVQILQLATEKANYNNRLETLNQRLELMAENTFPVKCAWRIRVGGHRGPESILLPAFDALGMPYIPSSTLRGIARTQAIREIMKDKKITDWKKAEQHPDIVKYFGSLEADNKQNKASKVIFFDAYPLPLPYKHGLTMDMANNIWKWEGNQLKYAPNPNPFLSLKEPTFKIGLKLVNGVKDTKILEKVKEWLINGLQMGVGSQVNSGYGEFLIAGQGQPNQGFLRVEFALEGQLIHGYQKFQNLKQPYQKNKNGKLKPDTIAQGEVRPIAFKSMLRYWFRAFALGVLDIKLIQKWEGNLFGAIQPDRQDGWIKFTIENGKTPPISNNDCGEQEGVLVLKYMPNLPQEHQESVRQLFDNLTWIMFHIGGVGQGARRPRYSRKNSPNPRPLYRGSTLFIEDPQDWARLSPNLPEFCQKFQKKIKGFYQALSNLTNPQNLNSQNHNNVLNVSSHQWAEIVDKNCIILVVGKKTSGNKPYALDVLLQQFHKLEDEMKQLQEDSEETNNPDESRKKAGQARQKYSEMKSLCGGVNKDIVSVNGEKIERGVIPSPIWIRDFERFQVVTIFGATADPRKRYLKKLQQDPQNYHQVFPL